jgi:arylsulfatase A-like enzyme
MISGLTARFGAACLVSILAWAGASLAQDQKPNILVIWGDDIGITNISHFNRGLMGYETPNIDRIAEEGISFTDYYGQQSCTAGRAAFIGGMNPARTGMKSSAGPVPWKAGRRRT